MAHGIFLLVIQTHPNNLRTGRPTKHIVVLENYLQSHPVSHLKTANTAKQIKLLWGWGPLGTLFSPVVHMAIYNGNYPSCCPSIPLGAKAEASVSGGQVEDGDSATCLPLSLHPHCGFAKILILPVLQGLVSMS